MQQDQGNRTNTGDGIFRRGSNDLMLALSKDAEGYTGTYKVAMLITRTDAHVDASADKRFILVISREIPPLFAFDMIVPQVSRNACKELLAGACSTSKTPTMRV